MYTATLVGRPLVNRAALLGALLIVLDARPSLGQTDYYNTDAGRPITIEDAAPVERRAFEVQAAPLRLDRMRPGVYTWGLDPELAYGILPRTHVELGFPLMLADVPGVSRSSGLAGVELGLLHNLNAETSIPALAVAADVLVPIGNLAADGAYASVKGIATRTLTWARFHVNAGYTFGDEADAGAAELSRWIVGAAADRAFPLRASLITAEIVARQPIDPDDDVEWTVGAGVRRQLAVRWAVDAGLGRRLSGPGGAWYATVGGAFAFGMPWRS
jgi:outer membrane putative beta-barrel porin/alpha-amylase